MMTKILVITNFYFPFTLPNVNSISIVRKKQDNKRFSQPAFTCSKLTIETLEQGVKDVQS